MGRQQGLVKKAMEIVKLAHVDVGLIIMSEEANSLVEFWSGDKTNLVKKYQDLSASPHYDFTVDDYELEVSNALALRPFHEQTRLREQAIQQYGFPVYVPPQQPPTIVNPPLYEENRPLKRQRFQLDDEASSCYSSQPSSPTPTMEATGALNSLRTLEADMAKLCDAAPQLHSARVGLSVPQQPTSPTSTVSSSATCSTVDTPPSSASPDMAEMDTATGISNAASCLGEIDVTGLLDYIGKLDRGSTCGGNTTPHSNSPTANSVKPDNTPVTPCFTPTFQFGGGSIWEGGPTISAFC